MCVPWIPEALNFVTFYLRENGQLKNFTTHESDKKTEKEEEICFLSVITLSYA